MAVVKTILTVVFIIISVALTVIILMQESKSAGLGAIAGAADTYWGKNKGRSMEGMLVKLTRIFVILFIVIAAVLNMSIFKMNGWLSQMRQSFFHKKKGRGLWRKQF